MFRTFRIPVLILVLCLLIFFAPLLLLPFFNHPSADDYISGIHLRREGLLHYQFFIYQNWGGRFMATFTGSLFAKNSFLYSHYYLHTLLLLLLDVCTLNFMLFQFYKTIFRDKFPRTLILLCSLLLAVLENTVAMESSTYLFWFSSAITYHLPVDLFILQLGLWLVFYRTQSPVIKRVISVVIAFLIVLINGFNELFIITQAYLIVVLLFSNILKKNRTYFLMVLLPIFLVSALVVLFAPGNSSRSSLLVPKSFITGDAVTLFQAGEVFWGICKNFLFWICAAGIFLFSNQQKERFFLPRSFKIFFDKPYLSFAGVFLFVFTSIGFAVVGLKGGIVPDRYLNAVTVIAMFLFLILFFMSGILIKKTDLPISSISNLSFVFFVTASVGIIANDFFKEEYQSLISAPVYNHIMNERESDLQQAAGNDSVALKSYIESLQNTITGSYKSSSATVSGWLSQKPPFLFYTDDLENDYGRNVLAEFYRIKKVSVAPMITK